MIWGGVTLLVVLLLFLMPSEARRIVYEEASTGLFLRASDVSDLARLDREDSAHRRATLIWSLANARMARNSKEMRSERHDVNDLIDAAQEEISYLENTLKVLQPEHVITFYGIQLHSEQEREEAEQIRSEILQGEPMLEVAKRHGVGVSPYDVAWPTSDEREERIYLALKERLPQETSDVLKLSDDEGFLIAKVIEVDARSARSRITERRRHLVLQEALRQQLVKYSLPENIWEVVQPTDLMLSERQERFLKQLDEQS